MSNVRENTKTIIDALDEVENAAYVEKYNGLRYPDIEDDEDAEIWRGKLLQHVGGIEVELTRLKLLL